MNTSGYPRLQCAFEWGTKSAKPGILLLVCCLLLGCQAAESLTSPSSRAIQIRPSAIGSRTIAILLFCDATVDISTLHTPAEYQSMLFTDGNRAFQSWSLGKASLSGQVFGWYRVTNLAGRSKTELLALAAGYNPGSFNITGYVLTSYTGTGVAVVRSG